jgi:hypothetical protein
MESASTVSTLVSDGGSRCASSRSRKSLGTSLAAATSSSSSRAHCSERRKANGLRASSVMRLLADRMPSTVPPASSTGR